MPHIDIGKVALFLTLLSSILSISRDRRLTCQKILNTHGLLQCWPCSLVGTATVIESAGRVFNYHHGQSFPLSLCGLISMARDNAQVGKGNCSTLPYSLKINFIDFQCYAANLNSTLSSIM